MDYCNLRVFTHYSIFNSIIKISDLIGYCKKNNIRAIGISEHENMFGFVEFSKLCKSAGIKPIFSCSLAVENLGSIVFFIKNLQGFQSLSHLLSQYKIHGTNNGKSYISYDMLSKLSGVFCVIGSENSIFQSNNITLIDSAFKRLNSIFKDNLFIEIQPTLNSQNMINLALAENIPIICTSPVHFLEKDDSEPFYIFKNIGENNTFDQENFDNFALSNNHMHTRKSLEKIFQTVFPDSDFSEGFENSLRIAKKCNFILEAQLPIIPKYSEGKEKNESKMLRRKSILGLKKRLENVPEDQWITYFNRLERELKVLEGKNFCGYFLVTADFIAKARELNIPIGPGRGSGAGSLVAYSLTITDMDPIQYGLIFERFLNPERNSMPDFDIDFCPVRRKEIIEYLKEKYGPYSITQIVTFMTLQPKAALKDVCRVYRVNFKDSNYITSLIPNDQINPIKLTDALNTIPQLKAMALNPTYKKVFEIALKLEGLTKSFSKHAAGIIILDKPAWEIFPVFKDDKNEIVGMFDLQDIEFVGGVKFDFLGLKTLTVISNAVKKIEERYNKIPTFNNIPLDDEQTFQLFMNGDLDGIFQFDGAGIRGIVLQLKPDCFDDLIVLNALYRPGPIKSIPSYIKRKHRKENVVYLHKMTEISLSPTYGIMVYQEQVMEIAKFCAGYTDGEADLLRRAMGKKKIEEMREQRNKFVQGALLKGISRNIADRLFDQMNEFAGYGFPKAHAATYSLIAYMCAYLKTHFPLEFLASFLSEDMALTEKIIRFISNVKSKGLNLLLPCVNRSEFEFTIENINAIEIDEKNSRQNSAIRYGLGALKNLGEEIIMKIINNRIKFGNYEDIYDFVSINYEILHKKSWEALVYSGALDSLGKRENLIDNLEDLKKRIPLEDKKDWSYFERLDREKKAFGFFLSSYLGPIENTLEQIGLRNSMQIERSSLKSCFFAGEISVMKRRRVNDTNFYAFVEVLDSQGIIYLAIFSRVLEKYSKIVQEGSFLVFNISVELKDEQKKYIVNEIYTVDEFLLKSHHLTIIIRNKTELQTIFDLLQNIAVGLTKVYIKNAMDNGEIFLIEQKFITDSLIFRTNLLASNIEHF